MTDKIEQEQMPRYSHGWERIIGRTTFYFRGIIRDAYWHNEWDWASDVQPTPPRINWTCEHKHKSWDNADLCAQKQFHEMVHDPKNDPTTRAEQNEIALKTISEVLEDNDNIDHEECRW